MQGALMQFRGSRGQSQPGLFLPDSMSEALADAMQHAAPTGRRKHIVKRLKVSEDDARRIAEGRASKAQLDHAFKVGGWPLVLEVFGRLLGEGLDQHLARERERHEANARRLGAVIRDIGASRSFGAERRGGVAAGLASDGGRECSRVGAGSAQGVEEEQ